MNPGRGVLRRLSELAATRAIRVLHSLPGRLRVHLPLLTHLPPGLAAREADLASLLALPDGITAAQVCRSTGNALIHYDPKLLTRREILDYLRALTRIVIGLSQRLEAADQDDDAGYSAAIAKMKCALRRGIKHRLVVDEEAVIEDEIWAET